MGIKAVKALIDAANAPSAKAVGQYPPISLRHKFVERAPVGQYVDAGDPLPLPEELLQGPTGAYIQSQGSPTKGAVLSAAEQALANERSVLSALLDSAAPQVDRVGRRLPLSAFETRTPRQTQLPLNPISTPELIEFIKGNQSPQFDAARTFIAKQNPQAPVTPAPLEVKDVKLADGWNTDTTDLKNLPNIYTKGVRQIIENKDGTKTRVPGASVSGVQDGLVDLWQRFRNAADGAAMTEDPVKSFKQYDDVVELVRRYGKEANGEDPTVLAPMVAALSKLDAPLRSRILEAAGNPPVFDFFTQAGFEKALPDINRATDTIAELPQDFNSGARGTVVETDKAYRKTLEQGDTPLANKLGAWQTKPDALSPPKTFQKFFAHADQGVPENADQFRAFWNTAFSEKNRYEFRARIMSSGSPNAKRIYELISPDNVSGPDEAMYNLMHNPEKFGIYSANRTIGTDHIYKASPQMYGTGEGSREFALTSLVGPQLSQIRAIEQPRLKEPHAELEKYLAEIKRMSKADQAAAIANLSQGERDGLLFPVARLPPPTGREVRDNTVITVGTKIDPRNNRHGGTGADRYLDEDTVVARQNMTALEKAEHYLYMLTPEVHVPTQGNATVLTETLGGDTSKVLDMDKFAPWVRARHGVPDANGNISFPDKHLSAEAVTKFLQYILKNNDPKFVPRMLPLIERSLAAMPDKPTTARARMFAEQVFFPNKKLVQKASDGTIFNIHGDRDAGRGAIAKELHGFKLNKFEEKATTRQEDLSEAIRLQNEQIKKLREGKPGSAKPGKTDQSSIYQMNPLTSPLRSLLV